MRLSNPAGEANSRIVAAEARTKLWINAASGLYIDKITRAGKKENTNIAVVPAIDFLLPHILYVALCILVPKTAAKPSP